MGARSSRVLLREASLFGTVKTTGRIGPTNWLGALRLFVAVPRGLAPSPCRFEGLKEGERSVSRVRRRTSRPRSGRVPWSKKGSRSPGTDEPWSESKPPAGDGRWPHGNPPAIIPSSASHTVADSPSWGENPGSLQAALDRVAYWVDFPQLTSSQVSSLGRRSLARALARAICCQPAVSSVADGSCVLK